MGMGAVALVAAIAIALVPDWLQWLPILLAAVAALLSVILLLPIYLIFGRVDRVIAALVADPWMQWRFSNETWRNWVRSRLAVERRRPKWAPGPVGFTLFAAATAACYAGGTALPDTTAGIMLFMIGSMALALLIILGLTLGLQGMITAGKYRRMLAGEPEVYIGRYGVLLGQEFLSFDLFNQELAGARCEDGDLVLRFMIATNRGRMPSLDHVPLPPEPAADLARLQQLLNEHYPGAAIALAPAG